MESRRRQNEAKARKQAIDKERAESEKRQKAIRKQFGELMYRVSLSQEVDSPSDHEAYRKSQMKELDELCFRAHNEKYLNRELSRGELKETPLSEEEKAPESVPIMSAYKQYQLWSQINQGLTPVVFDAKEREESIKQLYLLEENPVTAVKTRVLSPLEKQELLQCIMNEPTLSEPYTRQ